ncbi:MAG: hypothetical protein ACSHWZ_12925 [Sulfitobacter sp.]
MTRLLHLASAHGRLCLMAGLAAGLALPGLALYLQSWLPQMVAALLVITALRIGRRAALGALRDLRWGLAAVALLQLGLPLAIYAALSLAGLGQSTAALAAVLATAAPSLTGAPNLALMLGLDAGRMMQILVLGTALFPLTVLPLLLLMPGLGAPAVILAAALRLLGVILLATGAGFALRRWFFPNPNSDQIKALDGAAVLAFSVIVIGLIAPLNGALRSDPWAVVQWAVLAFAISYLLQGATLLALRKSALRDLAGPLAIGAGNRNIALFLVALPPEVMAPLMIFIGCWQLPMYLTPILLPSLYRRALAHD